MVMVMDLIMAVLGYSFIHVPWQFWQWCVLRQQGLAEHQPETISGVELVHDTSLLAAFGLGFRGGELVVHWLAFALNSSCSNSF